MERSTSDAAGIVYDIGVVYQTLGLPAFTHQAVPTANDGEVVIYYNGWDLKTLGESAAGKQRMRQDQYWYDDGEWTAEAGYYRILLPVPESNGKNWAEQVAHLRTIDEMWQPAPVCVAATALLVHLSQTGNEFLKDAWLRCAETHAERYRVALDVDCGRVFANCHWDGNRYERLWLIAAQKC